MEDDKLSIYICGAQCSGKTTLQKALEINPEFKKFNFKMQEEIARKWMINNGYTKEYLENRQNLYNLQLELLRLQTTNEFAEISDCNGAYSRFLWDRGVIDPIVFLKVFFGKNEATKSSKIPFVEKTLKRWKIGANVLVFVTKPKQSFLHQPDGIRIDSDFQAIISAHKSTVEMLEDFDISYTLIDEYEIAERVKTAVKCVKQKWPRILDDSS